MQADAELERIQQFTCAARQRIRRLDVLLDQQVRILELDPSLKGRNFRQKSKAYAFSQIELKIFALSVAIATLGAFIAGFWTARVP